MNRLIRQYDANGSGFVHGGSGLLSVYSDDEKAAINAMTGTDDDTYYMFLVNSVTKLDADGNNTVVSGYMPVGYQHGFIFEQFDVARTFAHELSHGAFALHHTFSANTESFRATEGTTNNLMDYTEHGATLNHKQWRWMHENHGKGLFGFLTDEEEGEGKTIYNYLTIDGNPIFEFLEAEFKKEYDTVYKYAIDHGGTTKGYDTKPKIIYVTNKISTDEGIKYNEEYNMSSKQYINDEKKGGSKEEVNKNVLFGNELNLNNAQDFTMMHRTQIKQDGPTIWYKSGDAAPLPIFYTEIVKVYPTIAYKIEDQVHFINEHCINEQKPDVIENEVNVSLAKIKIRPVFLTQKESYEPDNIDWNDVYNRTKGIKILFSELKYKGEHLESDKAFDWLDYDLVQGDNTYEILYEGGSFTCHFKKYDSPQISFLRKDGNTDKEYYIEENYISIGGDKSISVVLYKKNECNEIRLYPTDHRRYGTIPDTYNYTYTLSSTTGNIAVEIGKEFSITPPPDGTELILKDNDSEKGRISFKELNYDETLRPTLNLVVTSDGHSGNVSFDDYVKTTNEIYYAMGVEWQKGQTINLNVTESVLAEKITLLKKINPNKRIKTLDAIKTILEEKEGYNKQQYYIVILSDDEFKSSNNKPGVAGFVEKLGDNILYINESMADSSIPAHELGHCNGRNEFAIDYYDATKDNYETNPKTSNSTNVMGYGTFRHDFNKDQTDKIRENIKKRIK